MEKLRTIHLLEADYNTGTKRIFLQQAMTHPIEYNQMPKSQYAKKYSQAIDAVMVKRLFFDYLRIFKIPGIMISNDACGVTVFPTTKGTSTSYKNPHEHTSIHAIPYTDSPWQF